VTLNPEQQAELGRVGLELQEAERAARGDAGPERAALKAAHAELIESVKAGKVDLEKLGALEASLARADEARHRREAMALNRVQRVLDPSQRAAVAAAARTDGTPRGFDAGVLDVTLFDGGARKGEINWARTRLESYVSGLGLDPQQDKKVKAILDAEPLPPPDARQREVARKAALFDAFEREGFDALTYPQDTATEGRSPFLRLARFVAKVVPVLTPEQQTKLAAKLVEPEPRRPRRAPSDDEE